QKFMILDNEIKAQLAQYLELMEGDVLLRMNGGDEKVSRDMAALVEGLATRSPRTKAEHAEPERVPSFSVNRSGEDTGIVCAGIPLGHEFTSLVLALLQVSGRPPKEDESIIERVKKIEGKHHFETYISLSCQNCPVVVQAL